MATKEMVHQKFEEVKLLQGAVEGSLADAFEGHRGRLSDPV